MSLRSNIVSQFKYPHGVLGRLAGFIMANRKSNRQRNDWTVGLLGLEPHHRILEIGCGPGLALVACARMLDGGIVVGIDHSSLMVSQALKRASNEVRAGKAEVRLGSADDLAVQVPPFDRVLSLNVVQFFPDQEKVFCDIYALLVPGGRVATTYQPRSRKPTRADGLGVAESIALTMEAIGYQAVVIKELPLRPVPAFCVLGEKPS